MAAGPVTVDDLLDDWLVKVAPRRASAKTVDVYRTLSVHLRRQLGSVALNDLRPEQVEAFLLAEAKAGRSMSTLRKYRNILDRALRWAVRRRLVVWNAASTVELPPSSAVRDARQPRSLTGDETRILLASVEDHRLRGLLLAQGVPTRVVMEVLGHSQMSLTTDTYQHVMPTLLREAADEMQSLLGG